MCRTEADYGQVLFQVLLQASIVDSLKSGAKIKCAQL